MKKLTKLFMELGIVGGVCYLINWATNRFFGEGLFYYYSIVAQPVVARRMAVGKNFSVRVVDCWTEIEVFHNVLATPTSVVQDRFAQGAICILLCRNGELAAYAWTALDGYDEDEVRCHFEPSPVNVTAWDFDVFILPEFRSTLTFARLWDAVNAYLSDQNREWTFSRISRFNTKSINSHKRMGAITVTNLLFAVIGPAQLLVFPFRPYLSFSRSDKSVPIMNFEIPLKGAAADRK